MRSIKVKFGNENQETSLKEMAEYIFEFCENEPAEEVIMEQEIKNTIEKALEAFYGGARNEN